MDGLLPVGRGERPFEVEAAQGDPEFRVLGVGVAVVGGADHARAEANLAVPADRPIEPDREPFETGPASVDLDGGRPGSFTLGL